MRKSFGLREGEPPKRLRSNEFQKTSIGSSRQSRSSSTGLSSGKRQASLSRLPLPATGSKKKPFGRSNSSVGLDTKVKNSTLITPLGKGRRSSSEDRQQQHAVDRSKNTTKSDYMTPQRVLSVRKSISSNANRMSTMRLSGRGSQIGSKGSKDTRPLSDKSFQHSQVKKILDYLRSNEYPNKSLTSKSFPLSTKEFVNVFNFMFQSIDVKSLEVLPHARFEEQIINVLKSLHYPVNLPKSTFVTMGSLHSWPAVLGVLSFICDLANLYRNKLLSNVVALGFPNRDDMGFPIDRESDEKILFEHQLNCFDEFNNGVDEYPDQLEIYQANLLENKSVDMKYAQQLEQTKSKLHAEIGTLENEKSNRTNLMVQKETLKSDISKLNIYLQSVEAKINGKEEDIGLHINRSQEIASKNKLLETNINEIQGNLEQEGSNVGHYEKERNAFLGAEKRRVIETLLTDIEAIEKDIWQEEISLSRSRDSCQSVITRINSLLLQVMI